MKKSVLLLTSVALLAACEEEPNETSEVEEVEEVAADTTEEVLVEESNEEEENVEEGSEEEQEEESAFEAPVVDANAEPWVSDTGVVPQYIERQAGLTPETDEVLSILDAHYQYNRIYEDHLVYSYQLMYLLSEDEVRPVMMLGNYWDVALTNMHVELTVQTTEGDVLIDGEEIFLSYEEFGVIESGQEIPYYPALQADEETIEILEAIHDNPRIFQCSYRILSADEIESGEDYENSGYEPAGETLDILRPVQDDSFEVISLR